MKYYNTFAKIKAEEAELYQEILDKDIEYFEDDEFPEDLLLFSVEGLVEIRPFFYFILQNNLQEYGKI